jgi:hypothetical protein
VGLLVGADHVLYYISAPLKLEILEARETMAVGFIHNGKLSRTGELFTRACYQSKELTPGSIGYRVWSGHNVAIACCDLRDAEIARLTAAVQDALREAGVKSNILALVRDNWQQARLVHTMGVVLVRRRTQPLGENLQHLAAWSGQTLWRT